MEKSPLFPAIYAIIVGLGMIVQWTISYTKNQIPELVTEPVRIGFHIAAEFVTAVMLMISGIGMLLKWDAASWLFPLAIGMLLYTAIVSPGYFAQKGQWGFVWMFAGVIILALISLLMII
jgi:hypothetical protein